ncbi:MAG TPA: YIP1 family protein [Candidatus Methanoperedens sp.]|nr:YIP1 family protein [Candidatus Methanoperedens sp.]HLB70738.1 YIP1 family protein [Candidatus Methanoperedens sp.]
MVWMKQVLIYPDRFFGERSEMGTNLKVPFFIVLIVAVINAIDNVVLVHALTYRLSGYVVLFKVLFIAIIAIRTLVIPFIEWAFYAGIFYVISMLFRGEGSFKRVFEFTGYGFIPYIIIQLMGFAVTMTIFPEITALPESWIENPEILKQMIIQNQLMTVSSIITIFLMLWRAYIWIFGIKHARNISTKHAMITVGIPVGIGLIIIIAARFFNFLSMF